MNIKYVSGPVLVFRLENKKGHPIYIFGETHMPLTNQQECHISFDSIRIDQLFKKSFQQNKKIGFFLEIEPDISWYDDQYFKTRTLQYIDTLRTLLSDNLSFDSKTNKIISSKTFPNVMFHYFDIRILLSEALLFINRPEINIHNITEYLIKLKNNSIKILHDYKNNRNFKKIINKKYNNNKLKKDILLLQKDILSECFLFIKHIDIKIEKSKKYYQKYTEKKFIKNDNYFKKLEFKSSLLFSNSQNNILFYLIMYNDLYLLRRLLDKNYNTDVDYIYCGNLHAINITLFLLKYTDYKITHCTGNKKFIEENFQHYSTKWFVDNNDVIDNNTLGYTSFDGFNQCVDMSEFPQQLD